MAKKEIFVEEAILDDMSKGLSLVERPFSLRAFILFGVVTFVIIIAVFFKVISLNIVSGDAYSSRAFANAGSQEIIKAPRGIIYDRFGEALVKNTPSFSVFVNLAEILKSPEKISERINRISELVDIDKENIEKKILSANLEKESYILVSKDIPLSQAVEFKRMNVKWLFVQNEFLRNYIDGKIFSHVIGYVGLASEKQLKDNPDIGINDEMGKSGLEAYYNSNLSGTEGTSIIFKDAKGNIIDEKQEVAMQAGNNLYTSIDAGLQRYFYKSMTDNLASLSRYGGVGMVIDPQTGAVLSMISMPSYDNNNLVSSLFVDKKRPTFNRAVSGLYSPGSTIKPLHGIAALSEGIINTNTSIFSPGYIDVPNPYNPEHPTRFVDWRRQGWVNLYSAIARSSNVYFYEIGGGFEDQVGLGIKRLKEYWEKFLLDKKTGIDIVGESSGILPDPESKAERGGVWRLGDTYHVSIGQGSLMITPIELMDYVASIATNGYMPKPFLLAKETDSHDSVIFTRNVKKNIIDVKDKDSFSQVELGMIDGVKKSYGTSNMLASLPMKIAAKTGSAQFAGNTKTNAFFIGYNIPDGDKWKTEDINNLENGNLNYIPKQIEVLVLIEDAKEGSLNAVPLAKKIFQWYYDNRIKNQKDDYNTIK